jgi:hypothetical protein
MRRRRGYAGKRRNEREPLERRLLMSTDFTRRGGTPSRPDRERDADTDAPGDDEARKGRVEKGRPALSDVPVSPLVREQRDADARGSAPIRDRAAIGPAAYDSAWRSTVFTASGLSVVAGLWLIVAPFVLNYGVGDQAWSDVVFGGLVALLAVVRVAGAHRTEWMSWTVVVVGAWIFASAFLLDETTTASVNDIVVGALVAVFGVTSAMATHDAQRADAVAPPR